MIRISAPCRLHFGLFNAGPSFGGLGLMLDTPRVVVTAELAEEWSATGPHAERALEAAKRVTSRCHRLTVEQSPPQHAGLGVGTAISLAAASAAILAENRDVPVVEELARLVGRGRRSGIGMHGFVRGGFLHDAGKPNPDALPVLANRLTFPKNWQILLAHPDIPGTWHGEREIEAFAQTEVVGTHESLARPIAEAIQTRNFGAFCEMLTEFNRKAGELFEKQQGGIYAHPTIERTVQHLQNLGGQGVGQSSWGPTVYAFFQDEALFRGAFTHLQQTPDYRTRMTTVCDTGARIETS